MRGIKIADWMYKSYPTARLDKLIPRIPYVIPKDAIKLRGGGVNNAFKRITFGPQMRLLEIAKSLTDLIREERIELNYFRAYEVRNYTERLIMEAIRFGDCHRPTMDLANFYLNEKQLIHKLFKVLVPRYINYSESFTQMHLLPINVKATLDKCGGKTKHYQQAVLELKGNPFPSVRNEPIDNRNFLTNVLLRAAKHDYNKEKDKNNGKK